MPNITVAPDSFTRVLSSAYLWLARLADGRTGPTRRFFAGLADLSLRRRPELLGLDAAARMSVYREYRGLVESDRPFIDHHARAHAILGAGAVAGVASGMIVGLAAAAPWGLDGSMGAPLVRAARVIGLMLVGLFAGGLVGGLVSGLLARRLVRGAPAPPDWHAFVAEWRARATA